MLWNREYYSSEVIIFWSHADLSSAMEKKTEWILVAALYLHSYSVKIDREQKGMHWHLFVLQ